MRMFPMMTGHAVSVQTQGRTSRYWTLLRFAVLMTASIWFWRIASLFLVTQRATLRSERERQLGMSRPG